MKILNGIDVNTLLSYKVNTYDNSKIESLFRTYKIGELYMFSCKTYKKIESRIPYFIKEVCNKKRLHSSLSNILPEEFENIIMNE